VPYATTEVARNHLSRIWDGASTAVLGRRNAEGFLAYWPMVADDQNADPRDRAYAKWLVDAEKVVTTGARTTAASRRGTARRGAIPFDVAAFTRAGSCLRDP
jgi:hypothetical protein